ncbi:MAG TPA: LytTR family DNA-binding domain-containing protein, partial [Cytophagales bacterium]|nr:LytTR family DNA-binding domain-containing protein [Cytophagales bacterium]
FTTAYDEYALKAFKLNSIDYLLKPIDKAELRRALQKFKAQASNTNDRIRHAISSLLHPTKTYKERFLVKASDRLIPIQATDICYFASEGKYVVLYQKDKKYLVDYSLEELELLLDPKIFFRLNRQVTAQLPSIAKISSHLNGKLKIELTPPYAEEVFVSRDRAADFKKWLDGG